MNKQGVNPLEEELKNLLLLVWKEKKWNLKKIVFIFLIEPREYYSYIILLVPYYKININCWIEFFYEKNWVIEKYINLFHKKWIRFYNFIWIQLENMVWKNLSFKELKNN